MRAATHEERPLLCPALTRQQDSFGHPKSQATRIGLPTAKPKRAKKAAQPKPRRRPKLGALIL
jgi:hypothetical protein